MLICDYTLKRTEDHRERYYFKVSDASQFYMSVTTWQKQVLPMAPGLLNWIKNMSPEEQDQVLLETSAYGTFFHYLAKEYADRNRSFPLSELSMWIEGYRQHSEEPITDQETVGWEDRASKELYALNAFFVEKNVEPLIVNGQPATEIALVNRPEATAIQTSGDVSLYQTLDQLLLAYAQNPAFLFAGTLDLVCELDFDGKRTRAIVDYKTGRIWPNHPYQLEAYRLLWNQNFPEAPVEMIFNWRPKDWRLSSGPSYELKNQTGQVTPQTMAHLYGLAIQWCQSDPQPKIVFQDLQEGAGEYIIYNATEYYEEVQ